MITTASDLGEAQTSINRLWRFLMNIKIKSSDLLTQSIFFKTLVFVHQKKSVILLRKYELMIKFDFN